MWSQKTPRRYGGEGKIRFQEMTHTHTHTIEKYNCKVNRLHFYALCTFALMQEQNVKKRASAHYKFACPEAL